MSVLAHDRSMPPIGMHRPETRGVSYPGALAAGPHVAMIKRFCKFALALVLMALAVTAVMAIRVVAWFPPFYH